MTFLVVSPTPSPNDINGLTSSFDWVAIAVFLTLIAGALETIRRAYQAPDSMRRLYHSDRVRSRAAIASDRVVPELSALIREVVAHATEASGARVVLTRQEIEDSLLWAGYLDRLQLLSTLYSDYAALDKLLDVAIRWSRVKGGCAALSLIGLLPIAGRFALTWNAIPVWAWVPGLAMVLIAGTLTAGCWRQEIAARNELTRLISAYI